MLSNKKNGSIYIGATGNLIARVFAHRNKLIRSFTSKYNLVNLVYFEVYNDIETAFTREKQLKGWKRAWKKALIQRDNPDWKDLYNSIL